MFKKMPFVLLALMALIVCCNSLVPLSWKACAYAASLSMKSILMFLLPIVIFSLLFKTAAEFAKGATQMIAALLLVVCLSNFISTMLSYGVGHALYQYNGTIAFPQLGEGLAPAWTFAMPNWISNAHAMFAGLISGMMMARFSPKRAARIASILGTVVDRLLQLFIALMPVFIGGFIFKLAADGLIVKIMRDYAFIFAVVAAAQLGYILLLYLIAARFRLTVFVRSIRNMLPAGIAGFGAMSSAAALPLTLLGGEKNCDGSPIARAVIPATVNIHLIGDCLAIPVFAFAVLNNFGIAEPSFLSYLIFALYFVMAKFSVAAIPGGGILVMLPILEGYLGFNAEMMSLITALYILFDPVITGANVLGNGAFTMLFNNCFEKKPSRV